MIIITEPGWAQRALGITRNMPLPQATALVHDPSVEVRMRLATASQSPFILHKLMEDADVRVRRCVACNSAMRYNDLYFLEKRDADELVRRFARQERLDKLVVYE